MKSRRFKNDKERDWHTKIQLEAVESLDNSMKDTIEKLGLNVKIMNSHSLRVTDGIKRLDLYANRYWKLDTNERGNCSFAPYKIELVKEYFNLL